MELTSWLPPYHDPTDPLDLAALLSGWQPCDHCKGWGSTCDWNSAILCPNCRRPTYPTLGVNIPAGAAWAVSGGGVQLSLLDEVLANLRSDR